MADPIRISRVQQPDELKTREPLKWSTGTGADVWDLFGACIRGDLQPVARLVAKDPSIVRSPYAYRKPLYFAVRENQVDIARGRGYVEMETLLERRFAALHRASARGEAVAAAIRERDLAAPRALFGRGERAHRDREAAAAGGRPSERRRRELR